jgi:hypothetical protein
MQEWEYATLWVNFNETDGAYVIAQVNGQNIEDMKAAMFDSHHVPRLHEFLNVMGKVGWEVVGMSGMLTGGDLSRRTPLIVVLKRPK